MVLNWSHQKLSLQVYAMILNGVAPNQTDSGSYRSHSTNSLENEQGWGRTVPLSWSVQGTLNSVALIQTDSRGQRSHQNNSLKIEQGRGHRSL